MAPNKKKPPKDEKREVKRNGADDDDGWQDVSSDRRAPWLVKEEGVVVKGVLLGRFTMTQQGRPKGFYQVKISEGSVEAVQGRGEERENVTLGKGDVISIDENKALEDLRALCEDGGKYLVRITFGKLESLPGGNSFWNIKVQKKVLSPPTRKPEVKPDLGDPDDIPF